MRPGDVILSIADLQIKNSKHFLKTVADLEPFSHTKLKLKRGEEIIEVNIDRRKTDFQLISTNYSFALLGDGFRQKIPNSKSIQSGKASIN